MVAEPGLMTKLSFRYPYIYSVIGNENDSLYAYFSGSVSLRLFSNPLCWVPAASSSLDLRDVPSYASPAAKAATPENRGKMRPRRSPEEKLR